MLSARYLASISDDLIELYANLEAEIKRNMCKRIAKLGKNSDSIQWQADILAQSGALKSDIDLIISKYDSKAQVLIKQVFNEAMEKANASDLSFYNSALRELSGSQKQVLEASASRFLDTETINKTFSARAKKFSYDSTYDALQRMTMTVADSSQKEFLRECNNAYMKVNSGAFSYNDAIVDAVDNLAREDIKTIYYSGSGKTRAYSLENAVRMNVLTSVNQTASEQTLLNCEELGTDLVEVSAHVGARDVEREGRAWSNHSEWQGKVYCLNGERDYVDASGQVQHALNFYESCGLGEPDGICGINCRHSYYPYFEGTEKMYDKGTLDEYQEATVTLNGEEVSRYEAEQVQRGIERNIRKYKNIVEAYQYAGIENTPEAITKYNKARENLGYWQAQARAFTNETGLRRDYVREYVGVRGLGGQPRGITPKNLIPETPKPTLTPPTAPASEKNSVTVNTNKLYSQFVTKSEKASTEELIRYINSFPNADNTIKNIFNNMNANGSLNGVNFTITHTSGHKVKYGSNEIKLVINKLVANDPNIIGKAQTNIHELGHFFEKLANTDLRSINKSYFNLKDSIIKYRINSAGFIPKDIYKLVEDYKKEFESISNKIIKERHLELNKLTERLHNKEISYTEYSKLWNKTKREYNALLDNEIRNKSKGLSSLEDILDALSEGKLQSRNDVTFGHGQSYYRSDVMAQASEIFANYTALSITRPDLIKLLESYYPDLIAGCRQNADDILEALIKGN